MNTNKIVMMALDVIGFVIALPIIITEIANGPNVNSNLNVWTTLFMIAIVGRLWEWLGYFDSKQKSKS
jgi:hypothetical protein